MYITYFCWFFFCAFVSLLKKIILKHLMICIDGEILFGMFSTGFHAQLVNFQFQYSSIYIFMYRNFSFFSRFLRTVYLQRWTHFWLRKNAAIAISIRLTCSIVATSNIVYLLLHNFILYFVGFFLSLTSHSFVLFISLFNTVVYSFSFSFSLSIFCHRYQSLYFFSYFVYFHFQ